MTDERLRALERAWLSSRDAESEEALLHGLKRHGQLPRPRLLLAAYLGSVGAARLLGARGFPEEPNLLTWIRGLGKGRLARSPQLAHASAVRACLATLTVLEAHGLLAADMRRSRDLAAEWLGRDGEIEGFVSSMRKGAGVSLLLDDVVLAATCELAASGAASLVKEAGGLLRPKERKHQQVLRQAIYDALIAWTLVPDAS